MNRRSFVTRSACLPLLSSAGLLLRTGMQHAAAQGVAPGAVMAVGNRCGYPAEGFTDGGLQTETAGLVHVMPVPAHDLQLVYGNFSHNGPEFEFPGYNPITVAAQIEYPRGQLQPVTFAGRKEVSIAPGALVTSDPVAVTIPRGATYFTRTRVTTSVAPNKWPLNRVAVRSLGDSITAEGGPEVVRLEAGRVFACFGPLNILGRSDQPHSAVAILGDSVVAGEPGLGDELGDRGYIERALGARVPWCNLAAAGDNTTAFLRSHALRLRIIDGHFTHVICALGIGDVRSGKEERTRQNFIELWTELARLGLKVFQTTITTHTNSIDRWTTAEGQMVANPNFLPGGIYHRINAWIRSVPAPLSGVFDPAALLETSLDSGIWIAPDHRPVTTDGPHLDALGAEIAARSIEIGKL